MWIYFSSRAASDDYFPYLLTLLGQLFIVQSIIGLQNVMKKGKKERKRKDPISFKKSQGYFF